MYTKEKHLLTELKIEYSLFEFLSHLMCKKFKTILNIVNGKHSSKDRVYTNLRI